MMVYTSTVSFTDLSEATNLYLVAALPHSPAAANHRSFLITAIVSLCQSMPSAHTANFILNQNWNGSDGYAHICRVSRLSSIWLFEEHFSP